MSEFETEDEQIVGPPCSRRYSAFGSTASMPCSLRWESIRPTSSVDAARKIGWNQSSRSGENAHD